MNIQDYKTRKPKTDQLSAAVVSKLRELHNTGSFGQVRSQVVSALLSRRLVRVVRTEEFYQDPSLPTSYVVTTAGISFLKSQES